MVALVKSSTNPKVLKRPCTNILPTLISQAFAFCVRLLAGTLVVAWLMELNLPIFAQDGKPVIPKPSTHLINLSALWQMDWVRRGQGIRCRWEACREACDYLCLWVTVSALVPLAFFTVRSLSALNLDMRFSSPGVNLHHWEWEWGKQPQSSMATTCNGKPQEYQLWGNPVRGCPAYLTGHIQDQNWWLQLCTCGFHVWVWQAKLHDFNILYLLWKDLWRASPPPFSMFLPDPIFQMLGL